jgi:hypothetical protein
VTMGASLGPDPRISRQIPRHCDNVGFRGTREGDNVTMGASLGPDPRISRQIPRHRDNVGFRGTREGDNVTMEASLGRLGVLGAHGGDATQ